MKENTLMSMLASAVAPLAAFYVQVERNRDGEGGERDGALLKLAASKAVFEVDEILQGYRKTGDLRVRSQPEVVYTKYAANVEDDARSLAGQRVSGASVRYPAPTLATVAELLFAFGQIGDETTQDRRADRAVEEKRLEVQRLELELRLAKVKAGLPDDGPQQQAMMLKSAPPPAPASEDGWGTGDSGTRSAALKSTAAPAETGVATGSSAAVADDHSPGAILKRLMRCLCDALCDLAWCLLDLFCKDGKFDWDAADDPTFQTRLRDCLGAFLCSVLRCIPEALCPPRAPECTQPASNGCNFAVEG